MGTVCKIKPQHWHFHLWKRSKTLSLDLATTSVEYIKLQQHSIPNDMKYFSSYDRATPTLTLHLQLS